MLLDYTPGFSNTAPKLHLESSINFITPVFLKWYLHRIEKSMKYRKSEDFKHSKHYIEWRAFKIQVRLLKTPCPHFEKSHTKLYAIRFFLTE